MELEVSCGSGIVLRGVCAAIGADAPIDDFGLVDLISGVMVGCQAGCLADGAGDVGGFSAGSADDVMVVVTDAILVECGGTGGLYSSDEAFFGEHSEGVVDGLPGDGTDIGSHGLGDGVGGGVWHRRYGSEHGQALGRHLDAVIAQQGFRVFVHDWILY